jgi:hypothetical protein
VSRVTTKRVAVSVAFLAAVASCVGLVACAGSISEVAADHQDVDAGPVVASDCATDATLDVEAGTRICSDDNFCHSVVPAGQNLRGVWGDGLGIVWAFSDQGALLRWDGASWKIFAQLTTQGGINALWGSGPTDLWIAADGGLLHGTGATSATLVFAPVTLPGDPSRTIKSIWGTGPSDIWAVGGFEDLVSPQGRALHYSGSEADGGGGWAIDHDLSSRGVAFRAEWGSAGSGVWVEGQASSPLELRFSSVYRLTSGASGWRVVDLPDSSSWHPRPRELVAACMSSDTSVWLSGTGGDFDPMLFHGTNAAGFDAAFTWSVTQRSKFDRPIIALWGMAPNDTWAVGENGLVTHWNGATWVHAAIRVTSLPVAKSFRGIWGVSSNDFWIVGDEIALHKTNSGKP